MTHKTFSFWLCTLLSGIVIGIATQRIPDACAVEIRKPCYSDDASHLYLQSNRYLAKRDFHSPY